MADKKRDEKSLELFEARVVPVYIEEEMKSSYIDYAMSVIVGRALPDVRDGLKPAHRRILYAMYDKNWIHSNPYVKCAKIVGEVIGNFHPHGDMAVYDTLVRMAQDFTMRLPLIDGQGNFGSIDGDNPAAYRYTEARLDRVAEELLKDINKDTVDFVPNFDETRKEPSVLPSAVPNLLVNGANGIAVGMATNIPPHNLGEVIDAVVYYINNPECNISELIKYLPGPDFPTGGILYGSKGIREAYLTGKGKVTIRARAEVEEYKNKESIVITEIPYQVNKASLITSIAQLVKDRKIDGITNLRDESDRDGMRIVIELRRDANARVILNQLFKHTQMQTTFGIILLALVDNQPKILNLKEIIEEYVKHRKEVTIRRTKFDLKKAQDRAHILEGLIKALDMIDAIIKTIRASKTVEIAKNGLITKFKFTEIQAQAILDMKLQRLTGLEKQKLIDEYEGLLKLIKELKSILASEKKVYEVIQNELIAVKGNYSDERRTEIVKEIDDFTMEDIIADEDMVVTISRDGFIKTLQARSYRRQKRGGKGVIGATIKGDADYVKHIIVASMHDNLLFFSNKGKVFWIKVYEIPVGGKQSRGRSLNVLLNLSKDENVTATVSLKEFDKENQLVMITKKGIIKKVESNVVENAKKRGIISINLDKDDELVDVKVYRNGTDKNIFIGTANGKAININGDRIRTMGRATRGVRGITVAKDDRVIGVVIPEPNKYLIVVTENGFGKRVKYTNFAVKGRGGKGMIYLKVSNKNGSAAAISSVGEDDEVIVTTSNGMVLRTTAKEISTSGRNTMGVKIVNIDKDDKVSDLAIVSNE